MAFITLISDYGHVSPYVAALKGVIYSQLPDAQVIDVSHSIKPHDVLQAAYVLKNAAKYFPPGTVHIISVDTSIALNKQFLITAYKKHFYIGADNGIFSLLFEEKPENIYAVKHDLIDNHDLFPDKNLFAMLAVRIIHQEDFSAFTVPSNIHNVKQNISPVEEENLVRGSIVFIDGYGNAITNITKNLFDRKVKGKKRFSVFYRKREKINYISSNYNDVKNGNELALFNEAGLLEIAMNTGKAEQLLGLREGGQIFIEFYD